MRLQTETRVEEAIRIHETLTQSGRTVRLYPTPDVENGRELCVRDIAAHLAKICWLPNAYGGIYSAAQHACHLYDLLRDSGPLAQLLGLFYHAPAAYLGHVPLAARLAEKGMTSPPLCMDRRDSLEDELRRRILRYVGLGHVIDGPLYHSFEVARTYAEASLAAAERRDLLADTGEPVPREAANVKSRLHIWAWLQAEERFLLRYANAAALAGINERA